MRVTCKRWKQTGVQGEGSLSLPLGPHVVTGFFSTLQDVITVHSKVILREKHWAEDLMDLNLIDLLSSALLLFDKMRITFPDIKLKTDSPIFWNWIKDQLYIQIITTCFRSLLQTHKCLSNLHTALAPGKITHVKRKEKKKKRVNSLPLKTAYLPYTSTSNYEVSCMISPFPLKDFQTHIFLIWSSLNSDLVLNPPQQVYGNGKKVTLISCLITSSYC